MRFAGRRQATRAPTLLIATIATNPTTDELLGRNTSGTLRQSTAKVKNTWHANSARTRESSNPGTTNARPRVGARRSAMTIGLGGCQRGDPVRLDRGGRPLCRVYRAAERRVRPLAENRLPAGRKLL